MPALRQSLILAAGFAAVVAAAGCGGSGGGTVPTPATSATPPVILVAGSQRHFTGTETTMHVYANPSPGQSNSTAAATFSGVTTIATAPPGSPAAWDADVAVTYTVTQPAITGTQTLSTNTNLYENQTTSGSSTTVSEAGSKEVITANDIAAGNAGGGPYTLTTNNTTSYASPIVTRYPLQIGSTVEPLARMVTQTQTDVNSGGGTPPTSFLYITGQTLNYNNDGSFTANPRTFSNGHVYNVTENSNGSAAQNDTSSSYSQTIGLPALAGAAYTIPVSVTNTTGATTAYQAADWYPGAALPQTPLELDTVTVKGPAATLPTSCAGAITLPNLVEVDTNATTLNVFGSHVVEAQQAFNSNGIMDCIVRMTTTQLYNVTTGALTETTTDNYTQILKSETTGASVRRI